MKILKLLLLSIIAISANGQYVPMVGQIYQKNADLRAVRGTFTATAWVLGKDSMQDRQYNSYAWVDTATLSDDGRYVLDPSGGTIPGRWERTTNKYFAVKRNVSLSSTGVVIIDTTGPAFLGRCIVSQVIVSITALTGTQIGIYAISIGTNTSTYNNMYGALSLGTLTLNLGTVTAAASSTPLLPAGSIIRANITAIPTGLSGVTADIYLIGTYTQ